jgi:hypothetical protein
LIVSEERAKVEGNLAEDIKNVKRSGTADLLLHGGRAHPWLAKRMTDLGTAIAEHLSLEYGASEFSHLLERSVLVPGVRFNLASHARWTARVKPTPKSITE